jgi:hypothetical protein
MQKVIQNEKLPFRCVSWKKQMSLQQQQNHQWHDYALMCETNEKENEIN